MLITFSNPTVLHVILLSVYMCMAGAILQASKLQCVSKGNVNSANSCLSILSMIMTVEASCLVDTILLFCSLLLFETLVTCAMLM